MGLDDIEERNRRALTADRGLIKLGAKLAEKLERNAEPEPEQPFGLHRPKRGTSPLIVIPVLLVLMAGIGFYACRNADRKTAYERQMQGE